MENRIIAKLVLGCTFIFLMACTQNKNQNSSVDVTVDSEEKLGMVSMNVTGQKDALDEFEKGLLLLHSFEYDDARAAFQDAQSIDSNFYMAYWGEAMTHNHPLWSRTNLEDAQQILNKLGGTTAERLERAKTEYEKDLFQGVEILFGSGEKLDRDDAYAAHMETLYAKYPKDHEIASLYALSLLGSVDSGRDKEVYEKGASIAQKIIDQNPKHPGALHYLIHSYDDPEHAHKAVYAANNYSKVAPDAEHALHMPSHIYIALGDWDNVIKSNIASYEASKTKKEKKGLSNEKLGFHALHWLIYGHLQKGENQKALNLLKELELATSGLSVPRVASYRTMIEATFRTEQDIWESDLIDLKTDVSELNVIMQGINIYTQAKLALHKNDINKAQELISDLETKRKTAQTQALQKGSKMCSGVGWYNQLPTQVEVNQAHILELELKALIAEANNKDESVEKLLKLATKLEDETSFTFGPPQVVKPSHEMYADWLLKKGRKNDAKIQYEKALEKAPGRRLSLAGIKKCK